MASSLLLLAIAAVCGIAASIKKDADCRRDMVDITINKGYPIETHYVTTEDNYILSTFRIGYGRNESSEALNSGKPVVLLQHGLLDSSWTWVSNFPNQSLAFILADNGYGKCIHIIILKHNTHTHK